MQLCRHAFDFTVTAMYEAGAKLTLLSKQFCVGQLLAIMYETKEKGDLCAEVRVCRQLIHIRTRLRKAHKTFLLSFGRRLCIFPRIYSFQGHEPGVTAGEAKLP